MSTETVYRIVFLSPRDGSVTGVTDWFYEKPDKPENGVIERMIGTPELEDA